MTTTISLVAALWVVMGGVNLTLLLFPPPSRRPATAQHRREGK